MTTRNTQSNVRPRRAVVTIGRALAVALACVTVSIAAVGTLGAYTHVG